MKKICFTIVFFFMLSMLFDSRAFAVDFNSSVEKSKTQKVINVEKKVSESFDWNNYMEKVQTKVKKNWNPPFSKKSIRTVVIFSIDRSGNISSLAVKTSSNIPSADYAAIEAVKKSAPFEPFADYVKRNKVDVQITLDYNVHNYINRVNIGNDKFLAKKFFARGLLYYKSKKYNEAISYYTKAINLSPDDDNYYLYRGLAYLDKKDYSKAVDDFSAGIKLDSGNINFYLKRAAAYVELKQYNKAIVDLTKSIEFRPDVSAVYENRAHFYFLVADYNNAVLDYSKAIELAPKQADLYYFRAASYKNLLQYDKAIEDVLKAIKFEPKNTDYYYLIANIYELKEDYKTSFSYRRKAFKYEKRNK